MLNIRIEQTTNPKQKPSADNPLTFGTIFTDHMFIMDYDSKKGWYDERIVPYGPITLEPSSMVFHYGQEMFEGLKAYKAEDGQTLLFRADMNAKRNNRTNERICIPEINEEDYLQAIKELVKLENAWVPTKEGTSLYIRPFIIATDAFLGVRVSERYMFMVILSPVGAYYPEGLDPVKIWIEDEYVRAVVGGIGEAKAGANYVASLKAQAKAHEEGYSQVMWLDGVHRKYIEEVGAMNIFFKINGTIVTPALTGSILPGITRSSAITLCKDWGIPIEERRISIDEVYDAYKEGTLEEVFGTGTAAVISPVGHLRWSDKIMKVKDGRIGEISRRLYDTLTGIQTGKIKDSYGWTIKV